jgi:para-nitrobenzyl esterase
VCRCGHGAGLRGVPVPELFAHAQPFQPYGFGNRVLAEVPAQALRDGRFHRVPVISGGTRDEHRLFVGLFRALAGQPVTAEQYPELLAEAFGEHAEQVQASYPLSAYRSPNLAWATVLTDRMWARSTFTQHRLLAQQVPVYAYEFADRQAPMYLPFPDDFPPGAFHAAEVPYLFPDQPFQAASTPEQRRLSDQMMRYWDSFARTGDPTAPTCRHGRPSTTPGPCRTCSPWHQGPMASGRSTTPPSTNSTSGPACPDEPRQPSVSLSRSIRVPASPPGCSAVPEIGQKLRYP